MHPAPRTAHVRPRGRMRLIDGVKTKGIETESDIKVRKEFLRKIGYKL